MEKEEIKKIKEEIFKICYDSYKKDMDNSINGGIEDKDIWIIGVVVAITLDVLNRRHKLK